MKFEIEPQDIEAIAQRFTELVRPMLTDAGRNEEKDRIFDVKGLSEYLRVDPEWIYKQVSLRAIPYFKTGKYLKFRKRDIDKWIESNTARPTRR
jgi:excisionase family DNA binding protein